MATRKAPAKKAVAKKSAAPTNSREAVAERDDKVMGEIVAMREKDKDWSEIADKLRITPGKALHLYDRATFPRSERITGNTEKELGLAIVQAREKDLMSWGKIMNRANIGEGRARSLYEKFSKNPERGARIGKGGRYPGDVNPNGSNGSTARTTKAPAKAKATAKKAPVKRGAAKKAVASSGQKHPLQGLTKAELTERLVGKEVELGKVTGESRWVKVDAIKTVNDNTITVQSNGKVERLQILDMAKARAIA